VDVSIEEDLICGIQDLYQIEQHCYKSFLGSGNIKWLKILNKAREIRVKWRERIFKDEENTEKWCTEGHIFSSSTRFREVGTKMLSIEDPLSEEAFLDSGEILGMYYYLNEENPQEKKSFFEYLKKGIKYLVGGKDGVV